MAMPSLQVPQALPIPEADPKAWYQSRGIVGALIVMLAQLGAGFGYTVDAGMLTELAMQAITLVGGLLAFVGRLRAAQRVAPQAAGRGGKAL